MRLRTVVQLNLFDCQHLFRAQRKRHLYQPVLSEVAFGFGLAPIRAATAGRFRSQAQYYLSFTRGTAGSWPFCCLTSFLAFRFSGDDD